MFDGEQSDTHRWRCLWTRHWLGLRRRRLRFVSGRRRFRLRLGRRLFLYRLIGLLPRRDRRLLRRRRSWKSLQQGSMFLPINRRRRLYLCLLYFRGCICTLCRWKLYIGQELIKRRWVFLVHVFAAEKTRFLNLFLSWLNLLRWRLVYWFIFRRRSLVWKWRRFFRYGHLFGLWICRSTNKRVEEQLLSL